MCVCVCVIYLYIYVYITVREGQITYNNNCCVQQRPHHSIEGLELPLKCLALSWPQRGPLPCG